MPLNRKLDLHAVVLPALAALWLTFSVPAYAASSPGDPYLHGYIAAVLERELQWERGSYQLDVQGGVATITLATANPQRKDEALRQIGVIDGLTNVNIVTAMASSGEIPAPSFRAKLYDALDVMPEINALPTNDLFSPLIADPKEPRFFMSARSYHTPTDTVNIAAVGFGESFGLYRRPGKHPGDGLQLGISGGLLAQFNLDAPSFDLINADYILGLPITYRRGSLSARVRLYHQSSHLGDEFVLSANPDRVNLSYEAVDALVSYDLGAWRVYGGGEYLIHHEPSSLKPASLHAGMEYRGTNKVWGIGRLVGGLDLKSREEHDWSVDTSLSAGFEFGDPTPGRRKVRLMLDAYHGYAPHGQFYTDRVTYYGMGAGFDF